MRKPIEEYSCSSCRHVAPLAVVRLLNEQAPITPPAGQTAIVVPSKDQLIATLDTVISAVKAGELDEHLAQYAKARGVPKSSRAA